MSIYSFFFWFFSSFYVRERGEHLNSLEIFKYMGTTKTNQRKKEYIFQKVNEMGMAGLGYNEEKLIAEFILDCNTSRKTALEMLNVFATAERLIRKDGKVYSKAFFNNNLTLKQGVTENV